MLGNNNYDVFIGDNLLTDCDVLLCANEGGLLIDKQHIANFIMNRANECALSSAPNDTVIIDILRWNTLDISVRNYLSAPTSYGNQNFVYLMFEVNGEATTYGIFLAVEKIEINTKKWRAKLTLCSPFKTKTSLTSLWSYGGFDTFPNNTTVFEAIQHEAVNTGKGMVIPNYQDYQWNNYDMVDLNKNNIDVVFNDINIIGDIVESEDTNDRSNITFLGIKPQTPDTIHSETKEAVYDDFLEKYIVDFDDFNFDGKSFVITSMKVYSTHGGIDVSDQFDIWAYPNKIMCLTNRLQSSLGGINYQFVVEGYEAELDEPTTERYVKSYTWVTGSQGLIDAQTKTREYYSHKKYIDFDCRIDPRIEPLDNVFVPQVGLIKVERIKTTFNGGFKGHIKGRLIQGTELIAPVISDIYIDRYDEEFRFTVANNNGVEVTLFIDYSAGTESITLPANSATTITQVTFPHLLSSFIAYDYGVLEEDVYCYFSGDLFSDSDNTIILEEQV